MGNDLGILTHKGSKNMLETLIFYAGYNNYYDRKLMRGDEIDDDYIVCTVPNYNFVPGDGVITTAPNIVCNGNEGVENADYMLVTDGVNIKSRWFVLDAKRELKGVYTISLRRDVLADNIAFVMNTPCFVEKGIANPNTVAVYNDEGVTFNQIKVKEMPLKDATGCSWIVGYYNKGQFAESGFTAQELKGVSVGFTADEITPDAIVDKLSDWEYADYVGGVKLFNGQSGNRYTWTSYIKFNDEVSPSYFRDILQNYGSAFTLNREPISLQYADYVFSVAGGTEIRTAAHDHYAELISQAKTALEQHSAEEIAKFKNLNNTTLKVGDILYRVNVVENYNEVSATLTGANKSALNSVYADSGYSVGSHNPTVSATCLNYYIQLTEVDIRQYEYNITAERIHCVDEPYDIFAIPYSDDFKFYDDDAQDYVVCSKKVAIDVANGIISKYSGTSPVVYDVQLLPICPLKLTGKTYESGNPKEFSYIKNVTTHEVVGIIFNVPSSQISTSIPVNLAIADYKVENATQFCRLVSPNNNGVFEFSPSKNNGISDVTIDVALKPFQPYIHAAPLWSGLYGEYSTTDARGLICGGDFGLTMTSDAWQTYQRNNKNYLNSFYRQVETLDRANDITESQDWINAVLGSFQTSMQGFMVGGGIGAAVGGVLGLGAGATDAIINKSLREDEMQLQRDIFNMNMGNVKALPQGLARVDARTPNFKEFITLEFYSATDEEVKNFANLLKYRGMTINRIGTLSEYIGDGFAWAYPQDAGGDAIVTIYYPFISGVLINTDENKAYGTFLQNDYHMAMTIAEELKKGVYYYGA